MSPPTVRACSRMVGVEAAPAEEEDDGNGSTITGRPWSVSPLTRSIVSADDILGYSPESSYAYQPAALPAIQESWRLGGP